jgi:hypothetical protein
MEESKILSVQNKPDEHRQNWINHWERMTAERIRKQILQYKSKGRRDRARSPK